MSLTRANDVMIDEALDTRLPHDPRYSQGAAFVAGEIVPFAEAAIPMADWAILGGDVTYEKATVSRGRFFRIEDHFARFAKSCDGFRIVNPYSPEEMLDIFSELVRRTGLREAGVLWYIARGSSAEAHRRNDPNPGPAKLYAVASPYTSIATAEQRERGLDLMISKDHIRIPTRAVDPRIKNFNGQDMRLALFEASDHGHDWTVLTDVEGYLTEAAGANVFAVKDDTLLTPAEGGLLGITRLAALDLADLLGIPSRIEPVHARQLLDADEAFLTSSAGGIMPVNRVDGVLLGGLEGAGPITTRIHEEYWLRMWDGWMGTPIDYRIEADARA